MITANPTHTTVAKKKNTDRLFQRNRTNVRARMFGWRVVDTSESKKVGWSTELREKIIDKIFQDSFLSQPSTESHHNTDGGGRSEKQEKIEATNTKKRNADGEGFEEAKRTNFDGSRTDKAINQLV